MKLPQGMTTLVTGGSSGLRETTALQFLERSLNVMVVHLNAERGSTMAQKHGEQLRFVQADMADAQPRQRAIAPGLFDAPIVAKLPEKVRQSLAASVPHRARRDTSRSTRWLRYTSSKIPCSMAKPSASMGPSACSRAVAALGDGRGKRPWSSKSNQVRGGCERRP